MITPLVRVESRAAVMPETNIDTDIIFPARFLLLIDRAGMDRCLFHDRRYRADGSEDPEFPLNKDGFRDAKVLVVGPGFGCGSSREHAVWALVDNGIRVVVGTDFGDIFAGNALKNGLLLIRLAPEIHAEVVEKAKAGAEFIVDIPERRVAIGGVDLCRIDLSDEVLDAMIKGWDEMDVILNTELEHINGFEKRHRDAQPWLFSGA